MEYEDIHPDDSASQVGNLQERNERYQQEFNNHPIQYGQEDMESDRDTTTQSLSRVEEISIATRVRDNVKEYLLTMDKLKKIQAVGRDLRKRKTTLQSQIISDMTSLNVENLKLNKGSLVAKKSMPKVPLTKTSIASILSRHFSDDELINKIITVLYNERDRTEKFSLTHLMDKQK